MRQSQRYWLALLLFGGAVLLLASLFLPWAHATCKGVSAGYLNDGQYPSSALLGVFGSCGAAVVYNASNGVGVVPTLFALVLIAFAAGAAASRELASRLPLGSCAVLASYFALVAGLDTKRYADISTATGLRLHYASGAYLGIAGAAVALVATAALRRDALVRHVGASALVATAIVGALLATLVLPWERFGAHLVSPGIDQPAAIALAIAAVLAAAGWWKAATPRFERLTLATAALVFAAGALSAVFSPSNPPIFHAPAAWLAIGLAGCLVVFALMCLGPGRKLPLPSVRELCLAGAAAGLVLTLFLPWQRACYATGVSGPFAGRCFSTNGWTSALGSSIGAVAIGLLAILLLPGVLRTSVGELVTALAVLTPTLAVRVTNGGGGPVQLGLGYGGELGLACVAVLAVLAIAGSLRAPAGWRPAARQALALVCSGALIVLILAPWTGELPQHDLSFVRFLPPSWATLAAVAACLRLLVLWARPAEARSGLSGLVVLPLALIVLAAPALIAARAPLLNWDSGAFVVLALILAVAGLAEQRRGLRRAAVPELAG